MFSIVFTFGFLVILLFLTGKNIPVVHGDLANDCLAMGCYDPDVLALYNGVPQDCRGAYSTICTNHPGWTCTAACPAAAPPPAAPPPNNIYGNIIYASEHFESLSLAIFGGPSCGTFKDPGTIAGHFTKDSACKYVYGPEAAAGTAVPGPQAEICRLTGFVTENVECIGAAAPANPPPAVPPPADPPEKEPLPPPPGPPCAKWKGGDPNSGVCEMVATSLFQGKNKSDGDISTDPGQFIVRILTIILSFTGGIALLLIISAGYKIMTSKGKPEAIQQGRDQLISAIVGLVFIIFSFVIFQLVVTDLLKIPGIS